MTKGEVRLSEIMEYLPDGLGLYIGAEAKKQNKKYCFGQPQLKHGTMVFVDSFIEGIEKFGLGMPEFPTLFIHCDK